MSYYGWAPYVSVAQRRADAKKKMDKLRKKGQKIQPIEIEGQKIAKTFWGNAWCDHLEKFSDYSNRLPRGRTYVRNGSVCHLEIQKGQIKAKVSGSSLYNIKIQIDPLAKKLWKSIQSKCAGGVGSMLELLQGKLSDNVMKAVTDRQLGLFPQPKEINLNCDCPDWAIMCKHVAAVLYGIGARLDHSPELLFLLRGVDHMDLIDSEVKIPQSTGEKPQVSGDLSDIFGIDLEEESIPLKKTVKSKTVKAKTTKIPRAKTIAKTPKPIKKSTKKTPKIPTKKTLTSKINISRGIRASHIKKLRKELDMTELEFAGLLGKTTITIRNWEAKQGVLNLRPPSQKALETAFAMSKKEAWKSLGVK